MRLGYSELISKAYLRLWAYQGGDGVRNTPPLKSIEGYSLKEMNQVNNKNLGLPSQQTVYYRWRTCEIIGS